MKIEVDLNQNHHRLLMEIAARDKTFRSLASITRALLVDAITKETARYTVGRREAAVASLVAADLRQRRKAR